MSQVYKSCHTYMRHVTRIQVMRHVYESWHTSTSHVAGTKDTDMGWLRLVGLIKL